MLKVLHWGRSGRAAVAVAVAYALALQALLLAYGGALHAAPFGIDPGSAICLGSVSPENERDAPSPKTPDVLCCVLSCGGLSTPAAPLPSLDIAKEPPLTEASTAAAGFLDAPSGPWPVWPLGARAPPLTA